MIHAQRTYKTLDGLTFQEICEQAAILIVAGSETTASLLSAVTYLLLTNPPVFAKLTTIIRNAFKSEVEINSITVNNLDYLLAVLNEALRMYPPVPGIASRITPRQGCIIAGNFVPGNTCVSVNQWSANRSPSNFSRPEEFIPERWMGAAEFKDDKRKAVQPFSVGPRNCLGKSLAYVEMKIILARAIWNFDLELCEESRGWLEGQKLYIVAERPELMVRLKPISRG
jgi:cytochrome P450